MEERKVALDKDRNYFKNLCNRLANKSILIKRTEGKTKTAISYYKFNNHQDQKVDSNQIKGDSDQVKSDSNHLTSIQDKEKPINKDHKIDSDRIKVNSNQTEKSVPKPKLISVKSNRDIDIDSNQVKSDSDQIKGDSNQKKSGAPAKKVVVKNLSDTAIIRQMRKYLSEIPKSELPKEWKRISERLNRTDKNSNYQSNMAKYTVAILIEMGLIK